MFVPSMFKFDPVSICHAHFHQYIQVSRTFLNLGALALGTFGTDDLTFASTHLTRGLNLLHEARCQLVHLDPDASTLTCVADFNI